MALYVTLGFQRSTRARHSVAFVYLTTANGESHTDVLSCCGTHIFLRGLFLHPSMGQVVTQIWPATI